MAEEDDGEMFVYTGGDQVVPDDVRRVRIDKSVKIIPQRAFDGREHLLHVEFHDGIEEIGKWAFIRCILLRSVKLLGVKIIGEGAFSFCGLTDVEFGVELETLGACALLNCTSLTSLTMPSVKLIRRLAFSNCRQLTDLDLPEGLETIEASAFDGCHRLRRIAMPLKSDMIEDDAFYGCPKLATVDLVGGIHNTTASLHLEEWRHEMKGEINRINQVLRDTMRKDPTPIVRYWIRSVISQFDHYKAEHILLLKEATTLLELALWKARIEEKEEKEFVEGMEAKRAKIDIQSKRNERRITSGANIVIKNVFPFLELK
eukprot:scaffold297_cov104-Skeletonema_marinoi.AAC.1